MASSSIREAELGHPYGGLGGFLIIVSLIVLAFGLGVFSRCPGAGIGLCLDLKTTHRMLAPLPLVLFVLLFIVGIALVAYTGAPTVVRDGASPFLPPPPPVVTPPAPSPASMPPPATGVPMNPPERTPPP